MRLTRPGTEYRRTAAESLMACCRLRRAHRDGSDALPDVPERVAVRVGQRAPAVVRAVLSRRRNRRAVEQRAGRGAVDCRTNDAEEALERDRAGRAREVAG